MTEFAHAARRLLAPDPGGADARTVGERAERACEQLSHHLAGLFGQNGVTVLLRRSIALTAHEFPWLVFPSSAEDGTEREPSSALRHAMESQDPEVAAQAFIAVLSTFVGLLKRLIGESLVDRLLSEAWPTVFPRAVKETP